MGESKSSAVIIDIFTMRSTAQIAAFLKEYKKVRFFKVSDFLFRVRYSSEA